MKSSRWFSLLVDLFRVALAPRGCVACDAPLYPDGPWCEACQATLAVPRLERVAGLCVVAGGGFEGALQRAIHRLKYGDRPDLARPLGSWLAQCARAQGLRPALVAPVPLHPARLAERGFNQAALLAQPVAVAMEAPLRARALVRVRPTRAQATLGAADRGPNVAGAFRVGRPSMVQGRSVLLVDDVATTGATLGACATALVAAGASNVAALVLARPGKSGAVPAPVRGS